jgi:hypothetical protein
MDELHMTNLEENKFTSPNICHIVDDTSSVHVLKSSPTLSQLTTANCHIELEDSSVIKSEDASNYVMPFLH